MESTLAILEQLSDQDWEQAIPAIELMAERDLQGSSGFIKTSLDL